ncbi:MAG: bifunctional adenosylcobinamide kinase/adenosylcobinamide-phosphate guanylyltransferase [Alphaproteobacteria bacterium]|nr:bifunctional adenosylcobinamide kinase/adenosylcobinamide-phosphate guanylyltransferase [Alphaproteobacteria bacterium]
MITLVLGGARSGKSRYAEELAAQGGKPKLYIATSERLDAEMSERIARHQQDRAAAGWQTIEEPLAIAALLADNRFAGHSVLVDCLTLWLGNVLHYKRDVTAHSRALVMALAASKADVVLVSNEVGGGIVPDSALAREFRDAAGILHQQVAKIAGRVVLMVAGLPVNIKG